MDACVFHPDRPAIERCEVCQRPVCAACLWYAESGERLCRDHGRAWQAEGRAVHPPERYASGMTPDEAPSPQAHPSDAATYRGNGTDVAALVSAVVGIANLATCAGLSFLLPIVAVVLGLVGWLQGKDAVDPSRTRLLSGVGLFSGGILLLGAFGAVTLCLACWVFSVGLAASGSGSITVTAVP